MIILADGSKRSCPYVGPIQLRFVNRGGFTGALVMGDEVVLSSVDMQILDLVVSPATHQITVNPASPDIVTGRA